MRSKLPRKNGNNSRNDGRQLSFQSDISQLTLINVERVFDVEGIKNSRLSMDNRQKFVFSHMVSLKSKHTELLRQSMC